MPTTSVELCGILPIVQLNKVLLKANSTCRFHPSQLYSINSVNQTFLFFLLLLIPKALFFLARAIHL